MVETKKRSKKNEKEMDPELLMKLKFRRKCRFRAIGRMVLANIYWMIEASDEYEGVDDVKRRVAQAVRGVTKKKRLLSIMDKALLNKPAADRTDMEKKYIYRIIGGLKCFKRYPNHVKKKLASVTYFKYYGPGRVIVRQDQEAHALYFLVTGDVTVSQMIFDELLQQHVSVDIGILHQGDMFGEVSLLHNIPRTATCTTVGHCELLCLMKEDFKHILQASVQKQWDDVRNAMSAFTYFDALDEVARREGCIVAKMKSYAVNETILGDGMGIANFVYFILSGRCQMIESLNVITKISTGRVFYTLYDPYVPKQESEQDFDTKYFAGYNFEKSASTIISASKQQSNLEEENPRNECPRRSKAQSSMLKLETTKNLDSSREPSTALGSTHAGESQRATSTLRQESQVTGESQRATSILHHESQITGVSQRAISVLGHESQVMTEDKEQDEAENVSPDRITSFAIEKDILPPVHRESVRFSVVSQALPPPNIRTYFMQVCQFNPGSTFGFGENMRDRRIVALTPVYCMLLPKMWLLQRNTANIWTRIEYYLTKKIPNKKQLFASFCADRRWQEFRDQLVDDVVARSNTVNWTSIHDVPYSIRMEEMIDI